MSTKKHDIRKALRERLMTYSDLPEVNWEGRRFDPPKDDSGDLLPYIRETLIPSAEEQTANQEKTAIGFLALDYFVPIGFSIYDEESIAEGIKELFDPTQHIGGVNVIRSEVLEAVSDPPWYMIPIRVYYRAHQIQT